MTGDDGRSRGGSYFVAEGIPLTEFRDSDLNTPYPYQLATVTVWDVQSGAKLAEAEVVAPVSTEMHCDNCHSDGQQEDIATGNVEKNILTLHDMENQDEYPPGHQGALVDRAPILCAECHASNALGCARRGRGPQSVSRHPRQARGRGLAGPERLLPVPSRPADAVFA